MTTAFLDTDVLFDFLSGRQPFAHQAGRIFECVEQGEIKACTSSLCFNNMYYVLRKSNSHRKVISKLEELLNFLVVLPVNGAMLKNAMRSAFMDFEDAVQYQCAVTRKQVSVIITRNSKDYRHAEIPVMSPETFLKTLHSN
jgi:predicted nucleic acid-binding protein